MSINFTSHCEILINYSQLRNLFLFTSSPFSTASLGAGLFITHLTAKLEDTHAWVWALEGVDVESSIEDTVEHFCISAISVWEVAMLAHKKRLTFVPNVNTWVDRALNEFSIQLIGLEPAISLLSCNLPGTFHGDPSDRIIVATALYLSVPLVTADKQIKTYAKHNALKVISL